VANERTADRGGPWIRVRRGASGNSAPSHPARWSHAPRVTDGESRSAGRLSESEPDGGEISAKQIRKLDVVLDQRFSHPRRCESRHIGSASRAHAGRNAIACPPEPRVEHRRQQAGRIVGRLQQAVDMELKDREPVRVATSRTAEGGTKPVATPREP